jgi:hypothetical protein
MKNIIFSGIGIVIGVILVALMYHGNAMPVAGGIDTPIFSMQNSTRVLVTTSSTQVVATSSSRRYLLLGNDSSSPVYCNTNGRAAVNSTGFFMASSTSRSFDGSSLYTGAINCIASSTAPVTVTEAY